MRPNQPSICSTNSLLAPYGFSGCGGISSVAGFEEGVPYTVQLDEKTIAGVPASTMARSTDSDPATFTSK